MDAHVIGFLGMVFVGMTGINRILEGLYITASDVTVLNTLTIFRDMQVFGLFNVPILNGDFFFTGMGRLVKWDYSFFGGQGAIFQYLFYSLTFYVAIGCVLIFAGMVGQFWARR